MANGEKEVQDAIVERVGTPTALEVELDSQKAIARIEAIANVLSGCSKVSIQRTNPKDWVKMGDSFYLQATGAQKIRPIWGIYYRNREVEKETYPDGSYSYIITGEVGSKVLDQLYGEVTIQIDGGRSSTDKFFAKGNMVPDPMDIRKAALANWEARAVTALLGLKNMSQEDLRKNGINIDGVAKVDYQKGSMGGGKSDVLISQAQAKRLFAIAKNNGVDINKLKSHLLEKYFIESTSEVKRSDYEAIVSWAEAGGQTREAGEGE